MCPPGAPSYRDLVGKVLLFFDFKITRISMKKRTGQAFVDQLIVFAFCILIAVVLLYYMGVMQGVSWFVPVGMVSICLVIIFIFRSRIRRKVRESLH